MNTLLEKDTAVLDAEVIESLDDEFEEAAARRFLSKIGKKGATKGWANRSEEEKREHIEMMNEKRKQKRALEAKKPIPDVISAP